MIKFVARPINYQLRAALRRTAENGKAIIVARPLTVEYIVLRKEGLRLVCHKNGAHRYAWCEPIKKERKR